MEARPGVPSNRVPPQSEEAEKSILGACLLEKEPVWIASEILEEEDFYRAKHRKIWRAMAMLSAESKDVDLVSLSELLKKQESFEDVGGATYLGELTDVMPTTSRVEQWAMIVKEKSMLRRAITAGMHLVSSAYDPTADAFEVIEAGEKAIMEVQSHVGSAASFAEMLKNSLADLEAVHGTDGSITGVPLGLKKVDQMTTGFQNTDLIIIAARPSMGKSALALKALLESARSGIPAAIFTLEMSAGQLTKRLLYSVGKVDAQRARQGRLRDDDWPRLARAAGNLAELPIFIDDTPSMTITQIRSKLRRLKIEEDIGFAIVDYLQLISASLGRQANRENEIAYISRSLKGLAKELEIPILALSQLSRAPENRGGMMRPRLSDLRESGSIEQDADVVAFIYRAERYGISQDEDGNRTDGVAEIIIGKQRQGPIGTVSVAFVHNFVTFENFQPGLFGGKPQEIDDYTEPKRHDFGTGDEEPF